MEEELSVTLVQWEKRWLSPPGPIFLSFHFPSFAVGRFCSVLLGQETLLGCYSKRRPSCLVRAAAPA